MAIYERLCVFWIFIYTCLLTEGIVYLGCYQDDEYKRVLERELPDSDSNTPQACARRCTNFRYAGVEDWTKCFCGSTLNATPQQEKVCTYRCPGDSKYICGDLWKISVYTNWVTACGPPPAIANGYATLGMGSNLTYGSIADVNCDPGFIGKPTITCLSNTSWEKATCEQPGTTSIPVATLLNNIQSTPSSSTTANQYDVSNQEASQHGSTTTVIAAGVSVAVALAVAVVVSVLVLRKKQLLPCLKTTSTSYTGQHTYENGPQQSYEDLVDRKESNTNYCVLGIHIESADDNARYYNIESGQNN